MNHSAGDALVGTWLLAGDPVVSEIGAKSVYRIDGAIHVSRYVQCSGKSRVIAATEDGYVVVVQQRIGSCLDDWLQLASVFTVADPGFSRRPVHSLYHLLPLGTPRYAMAVILCTEVGVD